MDTPLAISVDFETYNTLDLKQVGAELYASSPDLIVTVVAWAIGRGPVSSRKLPSTLPDEIKDFLAAGGTLHAWNAAFEWAILHHHYGITLPWSQVACTMQKALYAGFPASLEKAGLALGIAPSMLKDNTNHRLMMQMAKPRQGGRKWHEDDPEKLAKLTAYCRQDVIAERTIAHRLGSCELPATEKAVSELDHRTNQRGLALDLDLIGKLATLARQETARLNQICGVLTGGEVTSPATQTARLSAWMLAQGFNHPTGLDKGAVVQLLKAKNIPDNVRQVLEIRQEVAKTSTRKLVAMTRCAGVDNRVRGQLMYYGASRTGRFSGKLIQPQNMPRPTLKKAFLKSAINAIRGGSVDRDWIDMVFGSPLEVVASSLRSCLIPGPGMKFVSYDFKQIEARVLAWLAGQQAVLDAFTRGEDIYVVAQKKVGLKSRQEGKVVVLACGFGMGPARFQETAKSYGLDFSMNEAQDIVDRWREANPEIVDLWHTTERRSRKALFVPGVFRAVNDKLGFTGLKNNQESLLIMHLPSARRLFYRNARIVDGKHQGGDLTYDGVDQITRRWTDIRTWGGKQVENAVQAIARDCLVDAALRVDDLHLGELVLSVHDELIWEVPEGDAEALSQLIKAEVES
jgi:DNA polymerase